MYSLISIAIGLMIPTIGYKLYRSRGICKWFYHDILRWHIPDGNTIDRLSYCAICKYCKKDIILDINGKWV